MIPFQQFCSLEDISFKSIVAKNGFCHLDLWSDSETIFMTVLFSVFSTKRKSLLKWRQTISPWVEKRCLYYTVWKSKNFSTFQILRQITLREFEVSISVFFTIFKWLWNLILVTLCYFQLQYFSKSKSCTSTIVEMAIFVISNSPEFIKIGVTNNWPKLNWRKFWVTGKFFNFHTV